jgi:hypothetical protein
MIRFPCTALLEVERKSSALRYPLLQNDGDHPPFSMLKDLVLQVFHDIFYDSDARLSGEGTYVPAVQRSVADEG